MVDKTSIPEFVRRLTFLSTRFPDYKIKVYTYYHDEIYDELEKLNIPFEKYRGFYYNTYAEDIRDYGVFLNIDKTEILDFTMDIENVKLFCCSTNIRNDTDMLRVIFNTTPPESLVIENIKEFVKEMMDNIFIDHKPLVFHKTIETKRKQYEHKNIVGDETITTNYEITETRTKKIKLE